MFKSSQKAQYPEPSSGVCYPEVRRLMTKYARTLVHWVGRDVRSDLARYMRWLFVLCVFNNCVWAQSIQVGPRVPISSPEGGWHNWIVIEADPNDEHNLIACGSKWSSQTNSLSGFLYASFDGGRSWQLKVNDASSPWVSEESCAFRPNGRAYFVADASKIVDGLTRHDLGQT